MNNPVFLIACRNSIGNRCKFQREGSVFGFSGAILTALAAVLLVSGCEITPDRTLVSSISTETHHPNIPNKKRVRPTPEKVTATTLDVQTVSYGFLGHSPYICTPSGFGRTSSCFRRG